MKYGIVSQVLHDEKPNLLRSRDGKPRVFSVFDKIAELPNCKLYAYITFQMSIQILLINLGT